MGYLSASDMVNYVVHDVMYLPFKISKKCHCFNFKGVHVSTVFIRLWAYYRCFANLCMYVPSIPTSVAIACLVVDQ